MLCKPHANLCFMAIESIAPSQTRTFVYDFQTGTVVLSFDCWLLKTKSPFDHETVFPDRAG